MGAGAAQIAPQGDASKAERGEHTREKSRDAREDGNRTGGEQPTSSGGDGERGASGSVGGERDAAGSVRGERGISGGERSAGGGGNGERHGSNRVSGEREGSRHGSSGEPGGSGERARGDREHGERPANSGSSEGTGESLAGGHAEAGTTAGMSKSRRRRRKRKNRAAAHAAGAMAQDGGSTNQGHAGMAVGAGAEGTSEAAVVPDAMLREFRQNGANGNGLHGGSSTGSGPNGSVSMGNGSNGNGANGNGVNGNGANGNGASVYGVNGTGASNGAGSTGSNGPIGQGFSSGGNGQSYSQNNGQNSGQGQGARRNKKKKFRRAGEGEGGPNNGPSFSPRPPRPEPGNSVQGSTSGMGQRRNRKQQQGGGGQSRGPRAFVGPMDHSYREANGNFADGPASTVQMSNGRHRSNGHRHFSEDRLPPELMHNSRPVAIPDGAPTHIYFFIEDLFFTAKIQEAAKQQGVKVAFVKPDKDIVAHLSELHDHEHPSLIVFDLNNAAAKPLTLIPKLKSKLKKGTSILGFLSHLQGDLKQKAVEAGCHTVMPRSAFSQNLPNLLRRYGVEDEHEPNFNQ